MTERPKIPAPLEREVKIEAGHRCAIPSCRFPRVEIAHIIPWSEVQEHKFENLIALCPNCHDLYDKDKKIDRKSMERYKANLGLLNYRYGEIERRILQLFCDNPGASIIRLPGPSELPVLFLLRDGLLQKAGNSGVFSGGVPTWDAYSLTEKGKTFLENWKQARSLD